MLFILSASDTLRPQAVDDNVVSEPSGTPQLPEAPSTHSMASFGGTRNVPCCLHWDELALCGEWKKPCKGHKITILLSAQSVMSGSCSYSLMRFIKTPRGETALSKLLQGLRNQNSGNHSCGSSLHLSAGALRHKARPVCSSPLCRHWGLYTTSAPTTRAG